MTVRDELERVLRLLADAYTVDSQTSWEAFDDEATELLVRHGPALLEAMKDADRWRTFVEAGWPVCFLGETYDTVSDLNRAIDRARRGGE
ncbi:hypothetical protein ACQKIE_18955 [Luteibacter sp. NPDC031894]|uniref:hypothetical protein n=1 Tax=Luteibacter sp. NPDC031894 TaxID=3390572 RepID=UPI003D00FA5A